MNNGKFYHQEAKDYFQVHLNYSNKLELDYLPHLYKHLAGESWAMAHGDNLLAMALQQREHIDAVLLNRKGKLQYIEHKFDFYKASLEKKFPGRRNVLIETVMNTRRNTPGWSRVTKADFILFAFERPPDEQCLEVYLVEWTLLKKWFDEHKDEYGPPYTNTNKPCPSTFYAIPIADIQNAMPVYSYRIHLNGTVEKLHSADILSTITRKDCTKNLIHGKIYQDEITPHETNKHEREHCYARTNCKCST